MDYHEFMVASVEADLLRLRTLERKPEGMEAEIGMLREMVLQAADYLDINVGGLSSEQFDRVEAAVSGYEMWRDSLKVDLADGVGAE